MADVSVEFGAKDVGLEKTLKTIQAEMADLQGKVTSGDLTMSELEKTMRRIGQVESMEKRLKAMGGESLDAGAKVDKLGKDITGTGDKADKTGGLFDSSFAKIAGAVAVGELAVKAFGAVLNAAFDAARSVIEGFKAALDLGGTLSDLSAQTGESAGNLLLLQRAFDNTGLGADKVGPTLAKLSAAINNTDEDSKKAALGFGRMGISLDELKGKSASEQLAIVSSGLQSIEDPGERAAAAVAVFGKSGAELLPLLSNFKGEMGEAAATVGSMAEIMDRRAAVFDAISDRFKIIQEKVRDFAAGILDRALPAIDAITSALSRIDAAAVGQKLADAFLGGQQAMKGFQAAVDAISIGKVGLAFEVFWESLKLQAMQTGEQIYKNLAASLATVRDTIVSMFGPGSGTFTLMIDSFAFAGKAAGVKLAEGILAMVPDINTSLLKVLDVLAIVMPGIAVPAKLAFEGADKALGVLRGSIGSMNESLEGSKNKLTESYDKFAANASESFAAIPEGFKQNLQKVPPLFTDIQSQQNKVAALEGQVKDAVSATNKEREASAANTEQELARRKEIKAAAEAAAEAEKAAKTELIQLETEINLAKASGNEELVKSLESQKKELENQAEIKKLTEDYQKNLGLNAEEAEQLATNFVNAKSAAAGVKVDSTSVTAAKTEASKAAAAAQSFATWLDYINGVDASAPVKSLKEKTADARKEITAFGEYIGVDLKNKSYPDIARELGIKNLGSTGSEQMQQILDYIASKRGELTGIQPIDEAGGKNSLQNIQAEITKLGSTQQTLNLDATASIESIKSKLKENIDLAVSTGEGTKTLTSINGFVEKMHTLVETLSQKLPTAALA